MTDGQSIIGCQLSLLQTARVITHMHHISLPMLLLLLLLMMMMTMMRVIVDE